MAQQSGDAIERAIRALRSLDAADLVLIEPPPSVWDGIEASIESGRGGLPGSPSPESTVAIVEYSIDASDVLAEVGAGWVDAAIDHGAPELARPADNRVLWESIDGDEMRALWQLVVRQVRSEQSEVRVPFRCDSAHARRWFEMAIAPVADGWCAFPVGARLPRGTQPDRAARPDHRARPRFGADRSVQLVRPRTIRRLMARHRAVGCRRTSARTRLAPSGDARDLRLMPGADVGRTPRPGSLRRIARLSTQGTNSGNLTTELRLGVQLASTRPGTAIAGRDEVGLTPSKSSPPRRAPDRGTPPTARVCHLSPGRGCSRRRGRSGTQENTSSA